MGAPPKVQPMFVSSTYRITRFTLGGAPMSTAWCTAHFCKLYLKNHWVTLHSWVRHLKCSLCLLCLFKQSLGYTVLTGPKARVWLALYSEKKGTVRFAKNQALFSLNVTPYFSPADSKNFFIIIEFFARVKQVWLSWVSIQRCKAVQEIITIIT